LLVFLDQQAPLQLAESPFRKQFPHFEIPGEEKSNIISAESSPAKSFLQFLS